MQTVLNNTPPVIRVNRTWEVMCHVAALLGTLVLGVPFGNVLGPLLVWLVKRSESEDIDEQGKESLNFQISVGIYLVGVGVFTLMVAVFVIVPIIGWFGLPILFLLVATGSSMVIANIILIVIASVKAGDGEIYRYPLNLRLIK